MLWKKEKKIDEEEVAVAVEEGEEEKPSCLGDLTRLVSRVIRSFVFTRSYTGTVR